MLYFCCEQKRRDAVAGSAVNGIDYLEVQDEPTDVIDQRQRYLWLHFINELTGPALTTSNFHIEGGERIAPVQVLSVTAGPESNVLIVEVDKAGDFSIYTLQIVTDSNQSTPPDVIDPMMAEIDFSFKVECPSDFDCKSEQICPSTPLMLPEINYLAKDYASFRRLMLDRMALLMPGWQERNPADLGVVLVELLAHVGDQLSYEQDAIATEAYLNTARRRVSVRRHARLVDYYMHDGCNARTWVQIRVNADHVILNKSTTKLFSSVPGQDPKIPIIETGSAAYRKALSTGPIVFELCEDKILYENHHEMSFHTWSDSRCCLPRGARCATLKKHLPDLYADDVVIFVELLGSRSGHSGDADPNRRHPVRLTRVIAFNENGDPLKDPLTQDEITEIFWSEEDALPFPFCISSRTDTGHGERLIENVSMALGNIVLADHGLTIEKESLGVVPEANLYPVPPPSGDRCKEQTLQPLPPRFMPALQKRPLTQKGPYKPKAAAAHAMRWSMNDVSPEITKVEAKSGDASWTWGEDPPDIPRDLLKSNKNDEHFVVEIENDNRAYLRFGDDQHGKRPDSGTEFTASYRIGNGVAGNIGAEALTHIVTDQNTVIGVRNVLPAWGGREPESMEKVRLRAPYAFRTQERAVTPGDYAEVTERQPDIQKAAATIRWTGSWHTVFLTVDRKGGLDVHSKFEEDTRSFVERYRMAGHDLEVDSPRPVSLEIDMQVCVKPDYFRSEVKKELFEVFSNSILPDGRRGLFHPDNFTFEQTVYLSPLYAAAQKVAGVDSVKITRFQRQSRPDMAAVHTGKLELNRLEIARLDNDPNFPERGIFRLDLGGGK